MYRLTVGILSWNRKDVIGVALDSVKKQTIFSEIEVIVLDNNSTDGTVEFIEENYSWVKLLKRETNSGLAEGRNILVKLANSPIVFWMDDDCELVGDNCLEYLLIQIENNPSFGIVYGRILEGGLDGDPHISLPADLSDRKKEFEMLEMFPATFASGGTCVRKDIFLELGGYDSDFFRMGVENCFSYKLFREGYLVNYFPQSTIIHRPHKYGRNFEIITFYSFRNRLTANWRYLPILPAFFLSLFDFILVLGKSLRNFKVLRGFLKGLIAFFIKLPKILLKERNPMKQEAFSKWAYSRHYFIQKEKDYEMLPNKYSLIKFCLMELNTRVLRRLGWKRAFIYLRKNNV